MVEHWYMFQKMEQYCDILFHFLEHWNTGTCSKKWISIQSNCPAKFNIIKFLMLIYGDFNLPVFQILTKYNFFPPYDNKLCLNGTCYSHSLSMKQVNIKNTMFHLDTHIIFCVCAAPDNYIYRDPKS